MSSQQEHATWQEILGQMIGDVQERQHIAAAVHVKPITLQRWANGTSKPRDENIRMLLKTLSPEIAPLFLRAISTDFPHLIQHDLIIGRTNPSIPTEFYARILSALSYTPQPMCRQTIQDFILQQAIEHLDPDRHGMSITLICCMPPRADQKILSLREIGGMGTHPWKRDLEQKLFFFGAESLVGHTIIGAHYSVINSKNEMTLYPAHWTDYEMSAAAFPILRHARIAGGLVASSALENFFTEARISALEQYAYLATLIFEAEEFYDIKNIDLRIMPDYVDQIQHFLDFNKRVSQKFSEALLQQKQITLSWARLLVWQDLEKELLQSVMRGRG
jgi:hypothetical protein